MVVNNLTATSCHKTAAADCHKANLTASGCHDLESSGEHRCSEGSACQRLSCSSTKYRPYISDLVRTRLIENYMSPGSLPISMPLHRVINNSGNYFPHDGSPSCNICQAKPYGYANFAAPNQQSTPIKNRFQRFGANNSSLDPESAGETLIFNLEI